MRSDGQNAHAQMKLSLTLGCRRKAMAKAKRGPAMSQNNII